MAVICREFGISRKTGYKIFNRYKDFGIRSLLLFVGGEVEDALDCLENCLIKVGNFSREWLVHDSDMDNIRHHPRYEKSISGFPG